MARGFSYVLILVLFAVLGGGCAHPSGPVPALTDTRFSMPGLNSRTTLRTTVRVDFEKLQSREPASAAQYLYESIVLYLEEPPTSQVELKYHVLPGLTTVTHSGNQAYPYRVVVELVAFPQVIPGQNLRVRGHNFHQRPDDPEGFVHLQVPAQLATDCIRITEVRIEEGRKETYRILAVTDREIPATVFMWHFFREEPYEMLRGGTRFFYREFSEESKPADHMIFAEMGVGECLTAPALPSY